MVLFQRSDWFLTNQFADEHMPQLDGSAVMKKARAYISRKTIACVPIHVCTDPQQQCVGEEGSSGGSCEEVITLNEELNASF